MYFIEIYCFAASALGATVVGEQPSVMEICLIMLNNQGNFIPDSKNFDFSVCVSINLYALPTMINASVHISYLLKLYVLCCYT